MATKLIIKNSSTASKVPSSSDIDRGELALNLADKKLYSKDASDVIFEIGGAVKSVNGETGEVVLELGDLDDVSIAGVTDKQVLVFDSGSSSWIPASAASLAVDVDLGYTPAADGGTVTNSAGDDAAIPMADGTTAGLSLNDFSTADKTKLGGIEDGAQVNPNLDDYLQKGDNVSELTNDAEYVAKGDNVSDLVNDAGYLTEVPVNPPSDTEPGDPSHGDLWVDTSVCPPVLKIYVDETECPGEGGWQEIEGGGSPSPIDPSPDDGDNSITPTPPGTGTDLDPYVLTAATVSAGNGTTSVETIAFSNGSPGDQVIFVDQNAAANGERFKQTAGLIQLDGTYSTKLSFSDTPQTDPDDKDYTGLLKIGSIYYSWTVSVQATVPGPIITQNPVISSATNETTTPITVDTRAAVSNATFTSSAWLKDGVVIPGANSTSSYTPTAAGTYKFREVFTGADTSTVNADSNELEITVDQTKPNATMSGLRFDSNRQTNLSKAVSGVSSSFTYSLWVKPTDASSPNHFMAPVGTEYLMSNNNKWYVDSKEVGGVTFELNKWVHFVVQNDNGTVKVWYNGSPTTYNGGTMENAWKNPTSIGIGKGSGNEEKSYTGNGYMSDVYFVDGEALEPEVFGKSFEGKWGPLDSAVVLENIKGKTKSPYEERPNMEQEWSAGSSTGTLSGPWSNAFNGDPATYAVATAESVLTLDTPIDISGKTVETLAAAANGEVVKINGITITTGSTNINSSRYVDNTAELSGQTQINTISIGGSSYAAFKSIKLDGQELVDGPADNSQNWSNYLSSNTSVVDGGNAFDGDTSTNGQGFDGIFNAVPPAGFYDLVFEPPAPIPGPVSVWTNTGNVSSGYGGQYQVDTGSGYGALDGTYTQGDWNEIVPAGQNLVKFRIQSTTNGTSFAAMKYGSDDKFLIDSGAQWDQSQVWSEGVSVVQGQESGIFTGIFDGVIPSVYTGTDSGGTMVDGGSPNASMVIDFPETLSGEVIIYPYFGTTSTCTIKFGTDAAIDLSAINASNTSFQPINLGVQSFNKITTTQTYISGALTAFDLAAISVGGKILVDAGTLGNNGFYLPFDPASSVVNYASQLSAFPDWEPGDTPDKAFNGNPTNLDKASATQMQASVAESTVTWIPAEPVTSFEVYTVLDPSGAEQTYTYSMNDGPFTANGTAGTGWRWHDLTAQIPDGGMTKFVHKATNISNNSVSGSAAGGAISGIRVNGKELIQPSAIGADASGNGNNFQAENFITGDRVTIAGEDWPSYGTGQATQSGGSSPGWDAMFDGDTTEGTLPDGARAITWDYTAQGGVTGTTLALYGYKNGTPGKLEVNGVDVTAEFPNHEGLGTNQRTVITSFNGTLNTITLTRPDGGASGPIVSGVEIDNALLIKNKTVVSTAPDTVLDTPMKNYAVLDSANTLADVVVSNGNLSATLTSDTGYKIAHSTIEMSSGKYYCEISRNSNPSVVVGLMNPTVLNTYSGAVYALHDGNILLTQSDGSSAVSQGNAGVAAPGDIVGIAVDKDNETIEFFRNGAFVFTLDTESWMTSFGVGLDQFCLGVINFGQQPFAYTPPAGYEGLYQTWEQYARTALGYTQDQLAEATRKLAAQEPYVQLMQAMIRTWQPGSTYQYGDIVQVNGMTYQAEANNINLISPDVATADGAILWRPLVRVSPAKTLNDIQPEPEQPTVLPAPEGETEIDFAPGVSGGSISTMPAEEEGPSDEEPPKKTVRRKKR